MNLKDHIIKLFEENNIKVKKLKGRQRTLYKVNGNLLYVTFKERVGNETEKENYYLQVNKRLVQESLAKREKLTIFIICGSLSQILTIDGEENQLNEIINYLFDKHSAVFEDKLLPSGKEKKEYLADVIQVLCACES